jgi:glycerol-3-phosphate cytidylyltransferase-like family protein
MVVIDYCYIKRLKAIDSKKYSNSYGNPLQRGSPNSSDKLNYSKKQKYPVCPQESRLRIVAALKAADEVFFEESLEIKAEYIKKYKADVLVMGDDWKGRFDEFMSICEVVYLDRTPSISTTKLIEIIKK